jgi:hypothetical protein
MLRRLNVKSGRVAGHHFASSEVHHLTLHQKTRPQMQSCAEEITEGAVRVFVGSLSYVNCNELRRKFENLIQKLFISIPSLVFDEQPWGGTPVVGFSQPQRDLLDFFS